MNQNNPSRQRTDLIEAVRFGDERAFSHLLKLYAPLLSSLVSAFSAGGRLDEELMQEARYALYRATLSYREGGVTFGLYAKICIRNALIAVCRRERRAELLCLSGNAAEADGIGADECASDVFLDALIHREALMELYGLAARVLSPYEHRVFAMYASGSLVEEIALALSRDVKSVRNALDRALAKLRAAYSDVTTSNS